MAGVKQVSAPHKPHEQHIVIFPSDCLSKGVRVGYVFSREVAEGIIKSFPDAVIDDPADHTPGHWHYFSGGPTLGYLRSHEPLGRCEKRPYGLSSR